MDGSGQACKVFVARFTPLVWRTVVMQMPGASLQDQEEAVANTFSRLLANRAELLGKYNRALGLSPESYIRRQAVYQARNRRRSLNTVARRVEEPFEILEDGSPGQDTCPDPRLDPEGLLIERQELDRLIRALEARLPPEVIVTFHYLYENGMTPVEVAKILGCSPDMIYVRRKRIVAAMKEIMAERNKRGGP